MVDDIAMWNRKKFILISILSIGGTESYIREFALKLSSGVELRQVGLAASINNDVKDREGRRSVLRYAAAVCAAIPLSSSLWAPAFCSPAHASEVRGPVELLRPATRVRLYIDQAAEICRSIQEQNETSISSTEPLAQFFANEPASFLTPEETKLSKRYLEIDTGSAWQSARLREREARGAEIGVDYTTPYDRFNTAIQQWGDKTQFQILRSRQIRLEQSDSLRAAFNAYTNNLVFGAAYQLNVQGDVKKNMVRSNALPDVNAVVVSDLDLRDLYRNQILQNVDNAKAELQYQRRTGDIDMAEILAFLVAAQTSCNDWFGFIPTADIQAALEAVAAEGKQNSA